MRPLPPGGTFRALLSFQPQQRTRYLETLTLHGTRTRIRVALKVRSSSSSVRHQEGGRPGHKPIIVNDILFLMRGCFWEP